jgi:hypothetical protein
MFLIAISLIDKNNSIVGDPEKLLEYRYAKRTHHNNSSPKLTINRDNKTCIFQKIVVSINDKESF